MKRILNYFLVGILCSMVAGSFTNAIFYRDVNWVILAIIMVVICGIILYKSIRVDTEKE